MFELQKGLTSDGDLDANINQNEERKKVDRFCLQDLSEKTLFVFCTLLRDDLASIMQAY